MLQEKQSNYIKSLQVLHYSLCFGILIFILIALYLVRFQGMKTEILKDDKMMQIMAIVLSAAAVVLGNMLFKKRLPAIEAEKNLAGKLNIYRSASIVHWAMLEGAALFCTISFLLTANYSFLGLAGMLLLLMLVHRPTLVKTVLQTGLSEQQIQTV